MRPFRNMLLVYPEVPNNTYWSFKYALRFIRKKSAQPPLGLITVAACFPDEYNLKLVDMNIESLKDADVEWADAVMVSAMIVQQDSVNAVVETCRRHGKKVILGGPYANSNWQDIKGVDHFVLGEIEDTFGTFLAQLQKGQAPYVFRCDSKPDMRQTRVPRFDLLNMDAYASVSIQYSRGCPFKCEFCDIWKVYGNRPRVKEPDSVMAELDALYEAGWRGPIFIVDDNFIGNKKHVKHALLPALMAWQTAHGHVFRFFTEASINMADDIELMEKMRDAGFNEVFIGIETPSAECLKETGKMQNLKTDLGQAVRTIQQYGIEVMAGFILGFDNDTDDIFDRQIEFIQQAGIPKAMVGLLTALPGTELYARLEKEGRIVSASAGNNTHCLKLNFNPRMDPERLMAGYRKVLGSVYDADLKNYFARCSRLLDNLGAAPYFQRKIGYREIIMLLKSVLTQPFKPYGRQYVKFVTYHFFKNRHLFGEVIAYCIIGHHFHTITQETLKIQQLSSYLDDRYQYLKAAVDRQTSRFAGNSKDLKDQPGAIEDLWRQRKEILEKCKAAMDKIHVDFRDDIRKKYIDMSEKIKDLYKTLETPPGMKTQRAGTR